MEIDRKAIAKIISKMLDNPSEVGVSPTTTAFNEIEQYIERARAEAIGWAHADCCVALDNGFDPRQQEISEMLSRAEHDLNNVISKLDDL